MIIDMLHCDRCRTQVVRIPGGSGQCRDGRSSSPYTLCWTSSAEWTGPTPEHNVPHLSYTDSPGSYTVLAKAPAYRGGPLYGWHYIIFNVFLLKKRGILPGWNLRTGVRSSIALIYLNKITNLKKCTYNLH